MDVHAGEGFFDVAEHILVKGNRQFGVQAALKKNLGTPLLDQFLNFLLHLVVA